MMNRSMLFGTIALAPLAVVACGPSAEANGAQPAAQEAAAAAPTRVIDVETVVVEPRPFTEFVAVTGDVAADREVVVASEESGVIREIYVDKGARVSAGQAVAKIDDSVLSAQFAQAQAEAELAAETWERQRRLWEDDSIGSEIAYLRAKYGAETAAANARALEARLARTVIRAPIDGTLDDRMIEVGSTVMPGSPVARVIDTNPLEVRAGIPERYAGDFRTGGTARLAFEHLPEREITGRLTFVGTAVDGQNRTFAVEIAVDDAGGRLKPGMVAKIQAPRRTIENALTVPRDAVLRSAEGYIVYVVEEREGRTVVRAAPVTTGPGAAGEVVVDSGLEPGDRVVVVGQQQLADGDAVRPVDRTGGA